MRHPLSCVKLSVINNLIIVHVMFMFPTLKPSSTTLDELVSLNSISVSITLSVDYYVSSACVLCAIIQYSV